MNTLTRLSAQHPLHAGFARLLDRARSAMSRKASAPVCPVKSRMRQERRAARSTAAVLWLMILLVFLPIAAAHLVAMKLEPAADSAATLQVGVD